MPQSSDLYLYHTVTFFIHISIRQPLKCTNKHFLYKTGNQTFCTRFLGSVHHIQYNIFMYILKKYVSLSCSRYIIYNYMKYVLLEYYSYRCRGVCLLIPTRYEQIQILKVFFGVGQE